MHAKPTLRRARTLRSMRLSRGASVECDHLKASASVVHAAHTLRVPCPPCVAVQSPVQISLSLRSLSLSDLSLSQISLSDLSLRSHVWTVIDCAFSDAASNVQGVRCYRYTEC
eukprot:7390561-Prymnesium_polylepis.1